MYYFPVNLYHNKPKNEIELQIEISETTYRADVFVKNTKYIIKLEKNIYKVYKCKS